ncbi:porin family protein [Maribacter sp. PR1]|uniref:Porin family protein n=1 Tax=Maribacter cobaltidurans TaxID=1178778 RepID=A0ABU7IZ84_9FLAO|nr:MULTISPECIES: porin family protein [Maribacter]MDC6390841.1 porin family protein [Maribacter sp. PR1]MEE1978233.1 porin family protein [Maribacter cobaltidurans]
MNRANAQDFNMGIKGGLNYSKTIAPGDDPFSARTSFHAGVFAEIPLRGKFSFHPEILYSSQGTKIKYARLENFDSPSVNQNDDVFVAKAEFLLIPLITRFNFNQNISLELGPQIGFEVSGGSFIDYGPTLGVGIDLPKNFSIQFRSYLGVSNVFRKSIVENQSLSDKIYYGLLQLSVGYVIF